MQISLSKYWCAVVFTVAVKAAVAATSCPTAVSGATAATLTVDGVLLARYALGMRGSALTAGIRNSPSLPTTVESSIAAAKTALDVDDDGAFTPTDALILARSMAGMPSTAWTAGISFGAAAKRTDANLIAQYIAAGCVAVSAGTVVIGATVIGQINYTLSKSGRISLAIYDTSGQMVRTLLNAAPRNAGANSETWDGKDDAGAALPAGQTYTVKILMTQGLRAEYLMTLQTTLPTGQGWVDRELALGNHDGPTSVAVDNSGIYLGTGGAENIANAMKMTWDGSKRLWSANQPAVWMGRHAMAVMGGRLYALQQDGWVIHQGVDEPNWPWSSVGAASNGDFIGSRWDALWPGAPRPGSDDYRDSPALQMNMDLAAHDNGNNPQLVITHRDQNTVQWRNPATGAVVDSVSIPAPMGVAFDAQGNVLVATQDRIVRVSRTNKTPQVLVSGLIGPYRIDVDRANNDEFVVAERSASQQVKRFSAVGALLATYGRSGGRLDGVYVDKDFRNITDVTSDQQGGFFVTERSAPRRVARFDRAGNVVKEWYAGSHWSPIATPEPGNPNVVWMQSEHNEYVRAELDYASRSWRVHSTYRIRRADGSLIWSLGTGIDVLKPRRVNGKLYLAGDGMNGEFTLWSVDEAQWSVRPIAAAAFQADTSNLWLWADSDGDGFAQPNEYRRFSENFYGYNALGLRSDAGLNYYAHNVGGSVIKIKVTGWNAIGAPIYEPIQSTSLMKWVSMPSELLKPNGESNNYGSAHPLAFASNGDVYGTFGVGDRGWSAVDAGLVVRWDATGKLLWNRKLGVSGSYYDNNHTHVPGVNMWSTFKNNVGIVYNAVVAQDFNGGNNGYAGQNISYVWNDDGLFVGGLFDAIDTTKVTARYYNLSSENGAGAIVEDSDGSALYFGGTEAANHVYRIRGWNEFARSSGQVRAP